jgi:hypothetical protein
MPKGNKLRLAEHFQELVQNHLDEKNPIRLHLSNKRIKDFFPPKKSCAEKFAGLDIKPAGLWYGINDSWINWCASEMPHWLSPYVYEVVVDETKILKINNLSKFDEFNKKYQEVPELINGLPTVFSRALDQINWESVTEKYAGIEIAPYLWQRRLSIIWYYGWDCASGVIWRKEAIKEIRLFAKFNGKKFMVYNGS